MRTSQKASRPIRAMSIILVLIAASEIRIANRIGVGLISYVNVTIAAVNANSAEYGPDLFVALHGAVLVALIDVDFQRRFFAVH